MTQSVNAALERTFQFFNLFTKHLNALEPRFHASTHWMSRRSSLH